MSTIKLNHTAAVVFRVSGAGGSCCYDNGPSVELLNGDWFQSSCMKNGKPSYANADGRSIRWEVPGEWGADNLGTAGAPKWIARVNGHDRYYNEQDTVQPPRNGWGARPAFATGAITLTYPARGDESEIVPGVVGGTVERASTPASVVSAASNERHSEEYASVSSADLGPDSQKTCGETTSGTFLQLRNLGTTVCDASGLSSMMGKSVTWQWEHRTGMKDYTDGASELIERAFLDGHPRVRLKTGKDGKTPKEIFFRNATWPDAYLQYDPNSSNEPRKVIRKGPLTIKDRFERFVNGVTRQIETGESRNQSFEEYKSLRDELENRKLESSVINFECKDAYHTGVSAVIVRSSYFFGLTMLVVVLNNIWLAYDVDENTADTIIDARSEFVGMEIFFVTFYTLELLIRLAAYEVKKNFYKDAWFMFDLILLVIMIIESIVIPVLIFVEVVSKEGASTLSNFRVLRLLRLLRLTKTFRMFPQLLMLVKGVVVALHPMLYTLLLLVVILYFFSLIITSQCKGVKGTVKPLIEDLFFDVPMTMESLLFHGTLMDGPAVVSKALHKDVSPFASMMFLLFVFCSAFTVLNMLIGVLCEVVSAVTAEENEKAEINYLKNNLLEVLKAYDKNDDNTIGPREFDNFLANPEVNTYLQEFGTDVRGLKSLKTSLFEEEKSENSVGSAIFDEDKVLSFNTVLTTILRLRGENVAKVSDVIELREFTRRELRHLRQLMGGNFDAAMPSNAKERKTIRVGFSGWSCSDDPTSPSSTTSGACSSERPHPQPLKEDTNTPLERPWEAVLDRLDKIDSSMNLLHNRIGQVEHGLNELRQQRL